jgi:hypothetical protein
MHRMRVELLGRTWRPFSWNVSNIDQQLVIRCGKLDPSSALQDQRWTSIIGWAIYGKWLLTGTSDRSGTSI